MEGKSWQVHTFFNEENVTPWGWWETLKEAMWLSCLVGKHGAILMLHLDIDHKRDFKQYTDHNVIKKEISLLQRRGVARVKITQH